MTRDEITAKLHEWCEAHPVRLCVLFGSQATGQTHARSDVDVAVWPTDPPTSATKLDWLYELEMLLGEDVSLVFVSVDLNPVLGWEIAREGCLVYEEEPGLWMKERARRWHLYNDALPFRRAARQRLHQFAEEVRRDS